MGAGSRGWARQRLHLRGFWLLLLHAVGHGTAALIEALHAVGLEVDAAGDVLDVLHVCPDEKVPQVGELTVCGVFN